MNMTKDEVINGLKFTVGMFLFDPDTGENLTEPRNDLDKTTIDACNGAIELLEQEFCNDAISRKSVLDKIREVCFSKDQRWVNFRVLHGSNGQRDFIINYIRELTPVKLENPSKKECWIVHKFGGVVHIECPKCSTWFLKQYLPRNSFCPNCGMRLWGGDK